YSSGMYMRLAFAVAAHLEPDILIVDDVLAVGDAEFQKKCLGKMQDVCARHGRTILYVSHNMPSVTNLCQRAMHLEQGKIVDIGQSSRVVSSYLSRHQQKLYLQRWENMEEAPGNSFVRIQFVELIPHLKSAEDPIDVRTPLTVRFKF